MIGFIFYLATCTVLVVQYWYMRDISISTKSYFKRIILFYIPFINVFVVTMNIYESMKGRLVHYYTKAEPKSLLNNNSLISEIPLEINSLVKIIKQQRLEILILFCLSVVSLGGIIGLFTLLLQHNIIEFNF